MKCHNKTLVGFWYVLGAEKCLKFQMSFFFILVELHMYPVTFVDNEGFHTECFLLYPHVRSSGEIRNYFVCPSVSPFVGLSVRPSVRPSVCAYFVRSITFVFGSTLACHIWHMGVSS